MVDKTTTTGGDDSATTTGTTAGTTTKRRPWEGRFGSGGSGGPRDGRPSLEVKKIRVVVARVLWAICAIFAVILAIAVLLIAVDANTKNELVRWMIARADNVDLGFFDLQNPIKDWDKDKDVVDDVKTALFNYGIAAIVWLGIGKLLDKIVRP